MNDRTKIEQPVAEEFKRFNEEFADSLRSETHRLQSAIDQILHASGKHVRPLLVLLTAKACGKSAPLIFSNENTGILIA